MVSLLRGQPHWRRLLAPHHQIDIVFSTQAMRDGGQETICIGREVHARKLGLEVQDGADEGRVLMRETIVLLPCPSGSLNVVEGATGLAPGCLGCLGRGKH